MSEHRSIIAVKRTRSSFVGIMGLLELLRKERQRWFPGLAEVGCHPDTLFRAHDSHDGLKKREVEVEFILIMRSQVVKERVNVFANEKML